MMNPLIVHEIAHDRITEFHRQAEQRRRVTQARRDNGALKIDSLLDAGGHGADHVRHASASPTIFDRMHRQGGGKRFEVGGVLSDVQPADASGRGT